MSNRFHFSSSLFRKIGATLVLILVMVILSLITITKEQYAKYFAQLLVSSAQDQGVLLSITAPKITGFSLEAEKAQILLPALMLSADIDSPIFKPHLLSLLAFSFRATVTGTLYSGECALDFSSSIVGDKTKVTGEIKGAKLGSWPFATAVGIQDGTLSLSANEMIFDTDGLTEGNLNFLLENLKKNKTTITERILIKSLISQSPVISRLVKDNSIPVQDSIPLFSNVSLKGRASLSTNMFNLSPVNLTIPLGSIDGQAKIKLPMKNSLEDLDANFVVNLTNEGHELASVFLPIASQGQLSAADRNFRVVAAGIKTLQQIRLLPLDKTPPSVKPEKAK